MKEKTETKVLVVILAMAAIAAMIALSVAGCGGSTSSETSTSTTITIGVPAPDCEVANNSLCAGDSAVFYDANVDNDLNYYGNVEYFYTFDGGANTYAANGSTDTFETPPLYSGVYYATLELDSVETDQYGNSYYSAIATSYCPPVVVRSCP